MIVDDSFQLSAGTLMDRELLSEVVLVNRGLMSAGLDSFGLSQ